MSSHSHKKDKITTDHSREETERVGKEQQHLKQKGKEIKESAKQAKDGNLSIPSNDTITSALQHGQETLASLQNSERGRNMAPAGDRVCNSTFSYLVYH